MVSLPLPDPDDFKVDPKELALLETYAATAINEARIMALSISNTKTRDDAAQWIRDNRAWIKGLDSGWFGKMRKSLHAMHGSFCDFIDKHVEPVEMGIKIVNQSITEWNIAQEKKRLEDEKKQFEAARKRDEEERLRLAQEHEAAGNPTMAAAVLDGVGQFVPPIIPQDKPKGMSPRKYWKAEVTDKRQLLKFLADKPGYENAVDINVTWLATQAKLMDGNLNVPGVRFFQQDSTTIR